MSVKYRPTPLLGIPLGAPPSGWSSPALPQVPRPRPSPPRQGPPDAGPPAGGLDPAAQVELLVDRSQHRLTPMDVQARRFARVRQGRGYDMRQVDQFLDEVAAELVRLHQHIHHLHDQQRQGRERWQGAAGADAGGAGPPDAEAAEGPPQLGRVRVLAVRVAADILADALCQAEEIYRNAYQQAAELMADATNDRQPPAPSGEDGSLGDTPEPAQSPPDLAGPTRQPDPPVPPPEPEARSAAGAVVAGPWDAAREQQP